MDSGPSEKSILEYSAATKRRISFWSVLILGIGGYVVIYAVLRICGVYYLFYNQGGWDIDGTTKIPVIDAAFLPLMLVEQLIHAAVPIMRAPAGG